MSAITRRWLPVLLGLYLIYLFALTTAGIVGPDEPRYASIAVAMARSGDWVTPRLWGEPWFEKPPLLYWMTALAVKLGAGPELAPRLPVALTSIAFLIFYFRMLAKELGELAAFFAAAILATSALWIAFSQVGVADLPMTAAYSAAMLCGMRWLSTRDRRLPVAAAFLLGVAVLGKGLVPLVLALPLLVFAAPRWRDWLRPAPILAFLVAAAPWYVVCTLRNGEPFLAEFFGRHHFARFTSGELLHAQPFWYYVPVLAGGLFPWIPLLIPLFRRRLYTNRTRYFLLAWAGFGFVFFSASSGKLPGYLLPLFPALAALAGLALPEIKSARALLAACCLLMPLIPVASFTFPGAFAVGLSRSTIGGWNWYFAAACVLAAVAVWRLDTAGRRRAAMSVALGLITLGVVYMKLDALPALDGQASARPLWRAVSSNPAAVCVDNIHRNWRYGLNYYSATPLPECENDPRPVRIIQRPGSPPSVE